MQDVFKLTSSLMKSVLEEEADAGEEEALAGGIVILHRSKAHLQAHPDQTMVAEEEGSVEV